jgi:hypothetical protein
MSSIHFILLLTAFGSTGTAKHTTALKCRQCSDRAVVDGVLKRGEWTVHDDVGLGIELGDWPIDDADPTRGNFVSLPYEFADPTLTTRRFVIYHLVTITFLPRDYRSWEHQ